MPCTSNTGSCDTGIMFRGKTKRLPEPPSEYSLDTIKSVETNSSFSGCDDYNVEGHQFDSNPSKPNESSSLVPKHSGYDNSFKFCILIALITKTTLI